MLNRIYANNFEDTHFPLRYPDSGFPDNLIVNISILVPSTDTTLYLYYVGVDGSTVTLDICKKPTGKSLEPYANCVWSKSAHMTSPLVSSDTGKTIGHVCFGSGISEDYSYIGPTELDPMCYVFDTHNTVSNISGSEVHTPERLNITVYGALNAVILPDPQDYSDSSCTCKLDFNGSVDGFLLDGRDRATFGCISTINGKPEPDHTLKVHLPAGFSAEYRDLISEDIKDPYRETNLNRLIVTIKEEDGAYLGQYKCPLNDPIIDIFSNREDSADNSNSSGHLEKPLDRYIKAYTQWRIAEYNMPEDESSSSSGGTTNPDIPGTGDKEIDLVTVNNTDKYTYNDGMEYNYSSPDKLDDAISLSIGADTIVLLKSNDGGWEE